MEYRSLDTRKADLHLHGYPRGMEAHIETRGSKNAVLPMIMYSFMFDECDIMLRNVPHIEDVVHTLDLLAAMGGKYSFDPESGTLHITHGITSSVIDMELIQKTRISILLLSILLSKFNGVSFPLNVGGCKLGSRDFNYHLHAFEAMGCKISIGEKTLEISRSPNRKLHSHYEFPQATTTGTENAIFLATHGSGHVSLSNPHLRPENLDLIEFLNKCNNNIVVHDNQVLIEPTQSQNIPRAEHQVIGDMEEALTYLSLGYLSDSRISVEFNNPYVYKEIEVIRGLTSEALCVCPNMLFANKTEPDSRLSYFELQTGPYPEVGSDNQPMLSSLMTKYAKRFRIVENRFTNRFSHNSHFQELGFQTKVEGNIFECSSNGIPEVTRSPAMLIAQNLRCAASALLLATHVNKPAIIKNINLLQRGYSDVYEKLRTLGFNFSIEHDRSRN